MRSDTLYVKEANMIKLLPPALLNEILDYLLGNDGICGFSRVMAGSSRKFESSGAAFKKTDQEEET